MIARSTFVFAAAAAAAVAAVAFDASPARAEMWTSTLGELITSATKIEVVRVDKVDGGKIEGAVVEAIRGASVGDHARFDLSRIAKPVIGDRVLVVCDNECPRAAAVDTGGWYHLAAQELGDGAVVTPSIVDAQSLAPLAGGKPAAPLCVHGTLAISDRDALPFELHVRAEDGTGATSIDGHDARVSLGPPFGGFGSQAVRLRFGAGDIEAVAQSFARGAAGCFDATFVPSNPIVRSRAGWNRAIAGNAMTSVFARGRLTVPAGLPSAGSHDFALAADAHGELVLTSDFASGRADETSYRADGHFVVGFPIHNDRFYPQLEIDLGARATAASDADRIAVVHAPPPTAAFAWITQAKPDGPLTTTRLGTAQLAYVPE